MTALARAAAPVLLALALCACNPLTRPSPVRQTYLLEPPMPAAVSRTQPGSVRVARVDVAAPFRGREFVYRVAPLRYETDYYDQFLVAPGAMFTEQTSRALAAAHVFARVAPPGTGGDSDATLDGFVSALYADARDGAPAAAELVVTYYLAREASGMTPVWSHEYRRHVDLAERTPAAYAAALNRAFGDILAELMHDLAALQLPAAPAGAS
jgi:cholesterol transport system auxiliary component